MMRGCASQNDDIHEDVNPEPMISVTALKKPSHTAPSRFLKQASSLLLQRMLGRLASQTSWPFKSTA